MVYGQFAGRYGSQGFGAAIARCLNGDRSAVARERRLIGKDNIMRDGNLKIFNFLAVVAISVSSVPMVAQSAGATARESAAASTDSARASESGRAQVEMRPVTGELQNKLDSKTAKVGDNVEVKTRSAVKTVDGTV